MSSFAVGWAAGAAVMAVVAFLILGHAEKRRKRDPKWLHYDHIPIERFWSMSMVLHEEVFGGEAWEWEICPGECDALAHHMIKTVFGFEDCKTWADALQERLDLARSRQDNSFYGTIHLGGGAMEYVDGPPPPQASVSLPDINDTLKNMVPLGWQWDGITHIETYTDNHCGAIGHDWTDWKNVVAVDPVTDTFAPVTYRTRACLNDECDAYEVQLLDDGMVHGD